MAEDSQQMKDDLLPPPSARHHPGTGNISGAHSQPSMPSQPSKEMLYQQRQKCELRRLLKHTHPELKMLDEAVDEELAEVLSSESGLTAAETGYEGEVLSRRWIFENCALSNKVDPHTPKMHMAEGTVERGDVNRTSALFEQPWESVKGITEAVERLNSSPDLNAEPVDGGAVEDILIANVKNRAQLFESMPFDKIRHQNKEEMETMVETINETLNSLYHFSAIHSDGSIIEVNETMIAKKAKYILSQSGPKINYDEVAEGGAQNFILQLLPRANLKPQVIYLKEDNQGNVEATVVNVGLSVHQHHFSPNQDAEFKTANVLQLIEDILTQDNSLRKGVIIQEDVNRCAEVIVYSLYKYAEGDVKKNQELRKGDVKSTISCLLATTQDQTCPGSIRPEVTVKGNVKLFRSCIEKGDLEYLKTLQAEPTVQEQELSPNLTQTVAGGSMETHHEQEGHQAEENKRDRWPLKS
ncbi:xin actin-binding repeat-containing protein 1-like [Centroberyx affinis]|uniref:xin actin-binding repeat-containing protein 1-like n=1 Tax=Centroberyx affinis TaxID=166261 RepID=UPI003A5C562F